MVLTKVVGATTCVVQASRNLLHPISFNLTLTYEKFSDKHLFL
jgi:hypothetical protein